MPPMYLFHGTSSTLLDDILDGGVTGPSFWGDEMIAAEFADERAKLTGGEPIIFSVPVGRFDESMLEPNDIAEGVAGVVDEGEAERLEGTDGSWQQSYEIVGSVVYRRTVNVTEYDLVRSEDDDLDFGM